MKKCNLPGVKTFNVEWDLTHSLHVLAIHMIVYYSDLRQIPDNQEVFAHPVTDQSVIIEILEYVDKEDEDAIR